MTSRNSEIVSSGLVEQGMKLKKLSPDEASSFLRFKLGDYELGDLEDEDTRENIEKISQALDGHSLALVHASSYIRETQCTLEYFIIIYNTRRRAIVVEYQPVAATLDYPLTFAACWTVSIEGLNTRSQELLGILSFMDPVSIPNELVRGYAVFKSEKKTIPCLTDLATFAASFGPLHRYSLASRNNKDRIISIHGLVQEATIRHLESRKMLNETFQQSLACVSRLFPRQVHGESMSEDFAECRRWIPHVLSLERNYKRLTHDLSQGEVVADSLELSEDLADLLGHAGWYLYEIGQTATATAILLTARKICEDLHGETPNATMAFIYTNLSCICNANNNSEQAIKLDESLSDSVKSSSARTTSKQGTPMPIMPSALPASINRKRRTSISKKPCGSKNPPRSNPRTFWREPIATWRATSCRWIGWTKPPNSSPKQCPIITTSPKAISSPLSPPS